MDAEVSAPRTRVLYPFPELPGAGTALAVAPGVHWVRMPLPFQLDHINLWLLEDSGGWTMVDCGIGDERTRQLWEAVLRAFPRITRVVLTHYHPDHAGNAAWACGRFGVELWTTQGEYLTAHAVRAAAAGYTSEAVLEVFARNGLPAERRAAMSGGGNRYARFVPDFPHAYRRVLDGERIRIGGRDWRVIVGYGHAPEHMSLYCPEANVLISGDMLLSTISTNVSVWSVDPEGDPLRLFLDSVRRYRELPADVLVLPSHGKPFRGAHLRVEQLQEHHDARFAELLGALASSGPRSAADVMPVLFPRALDAHQTYFAMGEAIAHLHCLYYAGRLHRQSGADGIVRYARA